MKKIYLAQARDQIARPNTIRDINRQIVLNFIRVRSPISRADIARATSLQRSTVSAIVDDLHAAGLVDEIGTGDSTGGRKPTLLKLRSGVPVVIGVDLAPRLTTISLADITGKLMKIETFPTSSDIGYMDEQILARVASLAQENPGNEMEIGISVPGIADDAKGNVVFVPYFNWSNWDICHKLNRATSLPVNIENDANAVALAELWLGDPETRKNRNFITVIVSEGVGTGIVINGEIYRGLNGAAGEFGHMYLGENAPVDCSCGRRDCWEAHASEKAMMKRYYGNGSASDAGSASMEHLMSLAQNGEQRAIGILKDTAADLGRGISNLIVGFSPQVVIVSGRIVKVWDLIQDEIIRYGRRGIQQQLAGAAIVPSSLGDMPTVLGSVSVVLAKKFASAT